MFTRSSNMNFIPTDNGNNNPVHFNQNLFNQRNLIPIPPKLKGTRSNIILHLCNQFDPIFRYLSKIEE